MSACRGCGRDVLWCRTEGGGRVAIVADEQPDGDRVPFGVTDKGEMVLRRVEPGAGRYVVHMPKSCESYLASIEQEAANDG